MRRSLFVALVMCAVGFGISTLAFAQTQTQPESVWNKLKAKYSATAGVNQLLFVKCTGGSSAEIEFYKKGANGQWTLDKSGKGYIGKKGLGKVKEGDMKTPEGDFGIRQAFGIKENPGTSIKYWRVTQSTYACGDHGKYYNTIIDAKKLNHVCHGEHMIKYQPQYNYGFETTYNNANVHGKGSAIFVHCVGKNPFTAGCISMDEALMKYIVQNSDAGIKICIHKK